MEINDIMYEAYTNAVSKGFYDCKNCRGKGCDPCNYTGTELNMNIPERLMLCVSELGEAMEAHRKNKFSHDIVENDKKYFEKNIKDTFEDEMADVIIRVLDLCHYMKIDIESHIRAKMDYNKTRPKFHKQNL